MHRAKSTICWSSRAICCALLSTGAVVVVAPPLLGRLAIDRLADGDEHAAESIATRTSPASAPGPPQRQRAEPPFHHLTIALLASVLITKNEGVVRRLR